MKNKVPKHFPSWAVNVERDSKKKLPKEIDVVLFLKDGEDHINVEVLLGRDERGLGLRAANELLKREIPDEWRKFYLIFPRTSCVDVRGYRYVPCLYWNGGRWVLLWYWLDGDFDRDDRLVVPRAPDSRTSGIKSQAIRILDEAREKIEKL